MLDYEWGNPSTIMLTGDEQSEEQDQNRQIFDHYTQQSFNNNLLQQQQTTTFSQNHFNHHHHHHHNPQTTVTTPAHVHSLYDPRAYTSASTYAPPPHHHSLLSLDPLPGGSGGGGYFMVPKSEEVSRPVDFNARIGLNLGGRTYFSSAEDDFVNRLYRRSRPGEPGSSNSPRCQAEGCNADLTHAKHYHRRHKVCEFHSKAATVIAAGLTQRFCQQCSRFHILSEFDNGKRSCRKRLADHNRRRRKSQQSTNQDNQKPQINNARNSPSDNITRSPQDSGAQSSSSVTVAVSPPRMSLDCFRQRPYQASASSATSGSLFFSSG